MYHCSVIHQAKDITTHMVKELVQRRSDMQHNREHCIILSSCIIFAARLFLELNRVLFNFGEYLTRVLFKFIFIFEEEEYLMWKNMYHIWRMYDEK